MNENKNNEQIIFPGGRNISFSQLLGEAPLELFTFFDGLFEERYSIGQVGIDRQELQFWRTKGLINIAESPTEKREWIQVSFFNLIWLKIVAEMRRLGISIDTIKEVQKFLYSIDNDVVEAMYQELINAPKYQKLHEQLGPNAVEELIKNSFDFKSYLSQNLNNLILIILAILDTNSPTYLIIEPNKEPELVFFNDNLIGSELDLEELFHRKNSFYTIYLNPLFDSFFQNKKIKEEDFQRTFKLSKAEKQIVQLLRKEGVKELRVRLNKQSKKGTLLVEVVENTDLDTMKNKLNGILEKGKFKQVKIQTEGNKLVFVEQTTKIKIENE